jgi:copper chaperone CopZ
MTHYYSITGMTCTSCQLKVQNLLSQVPGVKNISIDLAKGEATVEMDKHISTDIFKNTLKDYPKYQLSEKHDPIPTVEAGETRSWLATYKPILLIFGYNTALSLIIAGKADRFDELLGMRVFMSGFFLTFSFFKMIDLDGFADSYATYDIVAKKFRRWGYFYAFIELGLGVAYAINLQPFITNLVTVVTMTVSLIGVLQSVLNKKKIRCACLGAVFNLPMSTVTIIEGSLMIAMGAVALLTML